jgi:hypothetical protein
MQLLAKLSHDIKIDNSREDKWLVTINFPSSKINPHFYNKIKELASNLYREGAIAERIRSNMFLTNDLHGAITAVKLGNKYGADTRLFNVEEMDPDTSIDPDYEFRLTGDELYSVMRAVYFELKNARMRAYSPRDDIDELIIFLWLNEYGLRPDLENRAEDLRKILARCKYLEDRTRVLPKGQGFVLEHYNLGPIMRAVEAYLEEHKKDRSEDIEILFNILNRLNDEETEAFEPSRRDVEDLLHKRPVDNLIEAIRKSMIIRELL